MSGKNQFPEVKAEPEVPQPGLRFLESAVYIMGGLLVLMLLALIGGIAWKIVNRGSAPPPATQMLDLALEPGNAVSAMELDGDRLAIRTSAEIIVIDIRKNAIISRIAIAPK